MRNEQPSIKREWRSGLFLAHVKVERNGQWSEHVAKTDSSATHHFPAITAPANKRSINWVADTWLFPHGSRFNIPPPYPQEYHSLFNMVAVNIAGWVHLIKMHIYMMAKLNICHILRQTISNDFFHRNITQLNQWWGFCLQLHTTINYNIFIIYILMQTRSKPGCYSYMFFV